MSQLTGPPESFAANRAGLCAKRYPPNTTKAEGNGAPRLCITKLQTPLQEFDLAALGVVMPPPRVRTSRDEAYNDVCGGLGRPQCLVHPCPEKRLAVGRVHEDPPGPDLRQPVVLLGEEARRLGILGRSARIEVKRTEPCGPVSETVGGCSPLVRSGRRHVPAPAPVRALSPAPSHHPAGISAVEPRSPAGRLFKQ